MSVIFITGANRGIGLSLTQQYLKGNHKVYATYREATSAEALLSLAKNNINMTCIQLEITDYQTMGQLPWQMEPIEILINNAGYYGPKGYGLGNTDTSASGLIKVIKSANTELSGHFFNFDGSEIDW